MLTSVLYIAYSGDGGQRATLGRKLQQMLHIEVVKILRSMNSPIAVAKTWR